LVHHCTVVPLYRRTIVPWCTVVQFRWRLGALLASWYSCTTVPWYTVVPVYRWHLGAPFCPCDDVGACPASASPHLTRRRLIHSCLSTIADTDGCWLLHAGFQEEGSVKEAVADSLVIQLKACEVRAAKCDSEPVGEVPASPAFRGVCCCMYPAGSCIARWLVLG
jgi:hypothetical protein